MESRLKIAQLLLEIGAVSVRPSDPFTWASGKRAPIYCDNRLLMGHVAARRAIRDAFIELMNAQGWQPDVIAGTATAGIPHAAWLAETLELPMVYVRGKQKSHGKNKKIEGRLENQWRAVLIEDLISTGGSVIDAANSLREAGAQVDGVAAIFRYGLAEEAANFAAAQNLKAHTLTDLESLVAASIQTGALNPSDQAIVESWRQDPNAWSQQRGGK